MLSALSTGSSMSRCRKITVPVPDPYLTVYITFEQMYASDKTNWVSGPYYVGNIATGSVTDLFQSINNNTTYPITNNVKWGLQSFNLSNQSISRSLTEASYFLPESTGLSFCFWSKITSINTPNTNNTIFCLTDPNTLNVFGLRLRCDADTVGPYRINLCIDQKADIPNTMTNYIQRTLIQTTSWNHFVWTISPALYGATATHKVYVNNSLIYTEPGLRYPANVSRTFELGATNISQCMDTFRLYKKELNSAEINNIYTNLDPNGLRQ
jgi:hypothetical protein